MAELKNECARSAMWAALAAIIIFAAGSCGRGSQSTSSLSAGLDAAASKGICAPPQGDSNIPWDVQAGSVAGQVRVEWRGKHLGDYDLDGTVGVADITPIAMNYGAAVEYVDGLPVESGDNEYRACIDGDRNGVIGVADITPIAQHFSERCTGYRIYLGLRATGETELTWQTEYKTPQGNQFSPVTVPFNTSRNASEVQRYSFSFARPGGFEGFASVRIVATDGIGEGAMAESAEFAITGATDTAPPYNTGGIPGLNVAAKQGRALLSWGEWTDAQSPPVDIEIAWGMPPLDPGAASDRVILDAAAQTYEVGSLVNEQEYEFSCRFLDQAVPANATAWLTPISATPSAHLYALPPTGSAAVTPAAGLSPSVDAFRGVATPVYDAFAPVVAYISAGGGDAGQLIFARYDDGAWSTENVSTDTFAACSILTAADAPIIIAARLTPSPNVMRFWNDSELSGWNSETVFPGAASNLKTMRNEGDLAHPYVIFSTIGATPQINVAYWDGFGWEISSRTLGFANSILDVSVAKQPSDSSLQVLVTHGTIDPQQAQIDSTIACYEWDTFSRTWSLNGDYALPPDGAAPRAALSTSFWPGASPLFLGAASAIRLRHITFPISVDVPYGDMLGMDPSNFGSQPQWATIMQGTTDVNPLPPMTLTLGWYIEPRWTESSNAIVFIYVSGSLYFTLSPFTITGGSLAPSWWQASFNGSTWSAQALTISGSPIAGGRAQEMAPAPPGAAGSFQMVYTQMDTIDIYSLFGGELPSGSIYYARK